jgi:dsRNA-specific ribonuclease
VELTLPDGSACRASSTSMKKAEQCAAEQALAVLKAREAV